MGIWSKAYLVFVTVSCSLAFTSLGGALSWSSPSLFKLLAEDSPIPLTNSQASWIGSFLAIGAIIVAIPYTYLFNTIGRKWLIMLIGVFYIAGWITMIFATEVIHIYVGRFFLGCAAGPTYGVIPVYLAEIVSKNVRGANVALLIIFQSIGAFIQYGAGPLLSFQNQNIISIIFPVILFVTSFLIPESPYYLISVDKEDEAKSVLMRLRGTKEPKDIQEEYDGFKKCLVESPPMPITELWKELTLTKTRKIITIITISTFAQQFSGIGAIIVYMETIFTDIDSPIAPKDAVLITEGLADVTILLTFLIIDRVGRKPLLLTASLVCLSADIVLGLFFFLREDGIITNNYTWIGVLGIFLIQIGYAMGLGPVPLLIMSEVMSFGLKAWLSGFYLIAQGLFNIGAIKLFQILSDTIGSYFAYWLFAICILVSIGYLMMFMPETKGKSLQEIQHVLSGEEDYVNDGSMIEMSNKTEIKKVNSLESP